MAQAIPMFNLPTLNTQYETIQKTPTSNWMTAIGTGLKGVSELASGAAEAREITNKNALKREREELLRKIGTAMNSEDIAVIDAEIAELDKLINSQGNIEAPTEQPAMTLPQIGKPEENNIPVQQTPTEVIDQATALTEQPVMQESLTNIPSTSETPIATLPDLPQINAGSTPIAMNEMMMQGYKPNIDTVINRSNYGQFNLPLLQTDTISARGRA